MKRFLAAIFLVPALLSLQSSYSQTAMMKKQAAVIITRLKNNYEYAPGARDTLIDLNDDGYKDILIEYYGASGTGVKNRVMVYLYDPSKKNFSLCQVLNDLANPTFYFKKKIVTGYYISTGGGMAAKFRWKGLRLDSLERIDIDVFKNGSETAFKMSSYNYITKKKTYKTSENIWLPGEYRYCDYDHLIK